MELGPSPSCLRALSVTKTVHESGMMKNVRFPYLFVRRFISIYGLSVLKETQAS